MKFNLTVTSSFDIKDKAPYEELGFEFEEEDGLYGPWMTKSIVPITFNTLEELMVFVSQWEDIVITKGSWKQTLLLPTIEIYNYYRE